MDILGGMKAEATGAWTESITVKVTPEQLISKADEVSGEIKKFEQAFDTLTAAIDRTTGYWIGNAGNTHRRLYKESKEEVEEMLKRLKEHPTDLLKMAHLYQETEQKVREYAADLPDDIIV